MLGSILHTSFVGYSSNEILIYVMNPKNHLATTQNSMHNSETKSITNVQLNIKKYSK